jgi:hypothetical protein
MFGGNVLRLGCFDFKHKLKVIPLITVKKIMFNNKVVIGRVTNVWLDSDRLELKKIFGINFSHLFDVNGANRKRVEGLEDSVLNEFFAWRYVASQRVRYLRSSIWFYFVCGIVFFLMFPGGGFNIVLVIFWFLFSCKVIYDEHKLFRGHMVKFSEGVNGMGGLLERQIVNCSDRGVGMEYERSKLFGGLRVGKASTVVKSL